MSKTPAIPELGDVDNARMVYAATRDVWVGGGGWLEPHERLGLLTVAAGLRPFSLLNHLDKQPWDDTARLLAQFGLTCAPFKADFDYELDVTGPDAAMQAYIEHELKYPLDGLGVWSAARFVPLPAYPRSDCSSAIRCVAARWIAARKRTTTRLPCSN